MGWGSWLLPFATSHCSVCKSHNVFPALSLSSLKWKDALGYPQKAGALQAWSGVVTRGVSGLPFPWGRAWPPASPQSQLRGHVQLRTGRLGSPADAWLMHCAWLGRGQSASAAEFPETALAKVVITKPAGNQSLQISDTSQTLFLFCSGVFKDNLPSPLAKTASVPGTSTLSAIGTCRNISHCPYPHLISSRLFSPSQHRSSLSCTSQEEAACTSPPLTLHLVPAQPKPLYIYI